jgi:excisionase family DNA binding protein
MSEGLRNIEQAATWLGISKRTLEEYVTARSVPFTKVGRHVRFAQHHLDAIVEAGEQPAIQAPTRLEVTRQRSARRVA